MTHQKAEEIINKYGEALARGDDGVARFISLLPCSKAKIKYAYFVYLEYLIKNALLTKEKNQLLVSLYPHIESFINDEKAKEINEIWKQREDKKSVSEKKDKILLNFIKKIANPDLVEEITDYIEECYK